jgi:hypothetical protein
MSGVIFQSSSEGRDLVSPFDHRLKILPCFLSPCRPPPYARLVFSRGPTFMTLREKPNSRKGNREDKRD